MLNYLFYLSGIIYIILYLRSKKYDCIFCYQPSPVTSGIVSIFAAYFFKCKSIIWVQDLWPEALFNNNSKKNIIYYFIEWISLVIYKKHNYILCQSKSIVKKMETKFPTKNILYMPNFCEDEYRYLRTIQLNKELKNGKKTFVFAGNLGSSQNLEFIISAFEKVSNDSYEFDLLIIGDGRNKRKIEEIKDKKNLSFLKLFGNCSIKEICKYYEKADFMVLSLKSGVGNDITIPGKLQSYLMAGIPIVGSINGETNSIINHHNLGKCADANDQDTLIKNIKELININQTQYKKMVNDCINYYDNNFDIENCINILKEIINE